MPQAINCKGTCRALPPVRGLVLASLMALIAAPPLLATPPEADEDEISTMERIKQGLRGSSLLVGAGYIQGTFKAYAPEVQHNTQLTDNGKLNFLLDYHSSESALIKKPMAVGNFILGWDYDVNLGAFKADRQLVNSAVSGTDLGTQVTGRYLAAAPNLFIRMGPLYKDQPIFWSFGVGLGGAATQYSGNAQFGGTADTILEVNPGNKVHAALYETAFWQFEVGNWMLVFNSKYFLIHDPKLSSVTYEIYGLSLGYRINF